MAWIWNSTDPMRCLSGFSVTEDYLRPRLTKELNCGRSNAARPAGDDGHLVIEIDLHKQGTRSLVIGNRARSLETCSLSPVPCNLFPLLRRYKAGRDTTIHLGRERIHVLCVQFRS